MVYFARGFKEEQEDIFRLENHYEGGHDARERGGYVLNSALRNFELHNNGNYDNKGRVFGDYNSGGMGYKRNEIKGLRYDTDEIPNPLKAITPKPVNKLGA